MEKGGDLVKDVYESFLSDPSLTVMKSKKTSLELLWDYEPAPLAVEEIK